VSVNGIGPLELPASLQLSDSLLDTLAERVAAIVMERLQTSSDRRWLTVDQAADYIGRTPSAIRGLVKRGGLTPYKPDGRLQLDRLELDAWMRGERNA
jgi:excisionase family DNA binding protein